MRFYETIFIVKPDLAEEAFAERVAWATDILTDNGAQIVNVEQWGKKRLAYQVNKQRYGLYVMVHYEAEPKVVGELERNFKLSEDILKYMTVKLEGKHIDKARAAAVKAAEEAARRAEKPPEPEEAPEAEAASEPVAESVAEGEPEPDTATEAAAEAEEVEPAESPRPEEAE
jgi:small subunit ribosomal protein S6